MAKNSITDYSKTASLNTDIQSVDIDEGCLPSGINNAIRELMADLAAVNDGTVALTSPAFTSVDINSGTIDGVTIGGASAAAGTFTTGQFNTSLNVDGTVTADGVELSGTSVNLTLFETDQTDLNTRFRQTAGDIYIQTIVDDSSSAKSRLGIDHATGDIFFYEDTGTTAKLFWDASAESLGIGTTSPTLIAANGKVLQITGATTARSGQLRLSTSDNSQEAGFYVADGNVQFGSITNHPVLFRTNNTERMRIDSSGNVLVGTTSGLAKLHAKTSSSQFAILAENSNATYGALTVAHTASTGTRYLCDFRVGGTAAGNQEGSITSNGTGVSYNTSSDYRLKENVTGITDGIERVKQLNPSRFNFIADADTTVDGFLAHEAATVVPEAVTGEKDAVDADGNPDYQGIDQAKLVPLLTAALQEAITKIEDLEARVATLEGN